MWVASVFAIFGSGCGGPKYADSFREWFSLKLTAGAPVKVEAVNLEQMSSGRTEAVFSFDGRYRVLSDLYNPVLPPFDFAATNKAVAKLSVLEKYEDLVKKLQIAPLAEEIGKTQRTQFLRLATPRGLQKTFNGKCRARLNNDGSWTFEVIESSGLNLDGQKPPDGQWFVLGTPDGDAQAKKIAEPFARFVAVVNELEIAVKKERAANGDSAPISYPPPPMQPPSMPPPIFTDMGALLVDSTKEGASVNQPEVLSKQNIQSRESEIIGRWVTHTFVKEQSVAGGTVVFDLSADHSAFFVANDNALIGLETMKGRGTWEIRKTEKGEILRLTFSGRLSGTPPMLEQKIVRLSAETLILQDTEEHDGRFASISLRRE